MRKLIFIIIVVILAVGMSFYINNKKPKRFKGLFEAPPPPYITISFDDNQIIKLDDEVKMNELISLCEKADFKDLPNDVLIKEENTIFVDFNNGRAVISMLPAGKYGHIDSREWRWADMEIPDEVYDFIMNQINN